MDETMKKVVDKIKKGSEVKYLPKGTTISLTRGSRSETEVAGTGLWRGTLVGNGHTVTAEANGVMGLIQKLARRWLRDGGAMLQGKVQ